MYYLCGYYMENALNPSCSNYALEAAKLIIKNEKSELISDPEFVNISDRLLYLVQEAATIVLVSVISQTYYHLSNGDIAEALSLIRLGQTMCGVQGLLKKDGLALKQFLKAAKYQEEYARLYHLLTEEEAVEFKALLKELEKGGAAEEKEGELSFD